MTNIDHLPREMLLKIFNCVDKNSLRNCVRISKKWKSLATQASYEEITLQAFLIYKIKTMFKDNSLKQDDFFKQLHWTRKLKVEFDRGTSLRSTLED